jgi:hypothetical protein
MTYRRFVLEPAAEVAPDMLHPTTGWSLSKLLAHLNSALPYLAIAGPPGCGKTRLAQELLSRSLGWLIAQPAAAVQLSDPTLADPAAQLDSWARALDERQWPEVRATAVSDFWFDHLLVSAALQHSPEQLAAFHERWQQARERVATPKLTLVLDATAPWLAERWLAEHPQSTFDRELLEESLERQRAALLGYAGSPGLGPVLTLDAGNETVMLAEAQAAIEAMQ